MWAVPATCGLIARGYGPVLYRGPDPDAIDRPGHSTSLMLDWLTMSPKIEVSRAW